MNNSTIVTICSELPYTVNVVPFISMRKTHLVTIFTIAFNSISCPLAIAGNVLVFVAILRKPQLRTVYNTSVLFLAFTDLLVGLVAQPAFLVYQASKLLTVNFNCISLAIYTFIVFLGTGLSMITLCLVSLERYLAIFYPFKYNNYVTVHRIAFTFGIIWAAWTVFISLLRFYPGVNSTIYIMTGTVLIIVCIVVVLTVYVKVLRLTRRVKASVKPTIPLEPSVQPSLPSANSSPSIRAARGSKTVAYVTGALFICFAPSLYASAVYQARLLRRDVLYHVLYPLTDTAVLFNSCCNPLIYVWRSNSIKTSLKALLGCKTNSSNIETLNSISRSKRVTLQK